MLPMQVFIEQLRKNITNESVTIKPLNTGGGSYGIKYNVRHRIARVQELKRTGKYKCLCDSEKSRHLFDKIKDDYTKCPGYDYKGEDTRILYLERGEDMKEFLLAVIREYIREEDAAGSE